jgi:hypothetical protein
MKEIQTIIDVFPKVTAVEDFYPVFAACPTLNMLNAKYIIYHPEQPPLVNPFVDGNAWFVQSYAFVNTPDEEIAALETLNPKTEAVFDRTFNAVPDLEILPDSTASIEMTAYYPNKVEYQSSSAQTGLAVFSEVYYKNGWKAYIDGERTPIYRANWILRSLIVPAGNHRIEFVFDPDDIRVCGTITTIFSGLLLLLVIVSIIMSAIPFLQKRSNFEKE